MNWKVKLIALFATILTLSALVQLYMVVPYVAAYNVQPWWMPFLPLVLLSVAFGSAWWVIWPIVARQKRVEEKVRISERRFRDITENAQEWIWEIDADGIYTYISPVCERILGYKPEEILGKHFYDLFLPAEQEAMQQAAFELLAAKKPFREFINQNVRKDGDTVWLSSSGVPVLDEAGNFLGFRGADADITERKRAEEKLRESEERLQDLFDNASDLIQSVNPDGDFLFVNRTWREVLGYSQAEVARLKLWDIIHPDSMAHCQETFQRVMSGETVSGVEAVFVAKDGRSIAIEGNVSCRWEDGKPVHTRCVFRDVTEKKRVEAALDEALVKYETIITSMSEVVMITQPDGTITFLSPSCEKVLGYRARELVGTKGGIIHPDDSAGLKKSFGGALRGKTGKDLEYRIYAKDGEIKWVSHSFSPVTADGKVQMIVSTVKDVTARKLAMAKLQESEARYQNLVENSADGIMVIQKREVKFVNRAVLRIFGFKDKSEIEGRPFIDLVAPEQRELMRQRGRSRARGTVVPDHYEFRALRKDGTAFDCDFFVSNVVHQGVAVRQAILRDITERKRAETALRESKERMAAFMDSATDSFLLFDAELNLVDLNRHSLKYRSSRKEKLIGKNVLELSPKVRENGRYKKYLEVLRTGEPFFTEDVIVKPEGDRHRLVRAFKMGNGLGIMIANITERKEMEFRLQQQMEALDIQNEELISQSNELMRNQHELMQKSLELEEGSREKSRFLANMSHELRTPLNAIIGFSELMVDGITGEVNTEQGQCLDDILASGHHLLDLINDILDMSKVEAGRMEVEITELDLGEVVNEAVKVVRPLVQKDKLELSVVLEADLPPVLADGNRVKQVLLNLLSNAIKFTPAGGAITVRAKDDAGVMQVSVEDTGCGIKKRDREQIFRAYTQTDTLPDKKLEGTGLGLKLCRQFVELMGGGIAVSSRLHRGSVFTFTLPLAPADAPVEDTAEDSRPRVVMGDLMVTEVYQAWREGAGYDTIRPRATEDAVES